MKGQKPLHGEITNSKTKGKYYSYFVIVSILKRAYPRSKPRASLIWFGGRIKISVKTQQAGFWLLLLGKFLTLL